MLRQPFEILHRGLQTFPFSEPLKYTANKTTADTITIQLPLEANHPMEEILWFLRRKAAVINNNEWTKETEEKLVIKNAIKQVANKNIKQIQTWKQENPDCIHSESRKNDQYMNIVMNSMSGGYNEEQFTNISQIVKNVAKAVVIDKV